MLMICDRYPLLRKMFKHIIPWIPLHAVHNMKRLVDTLDNTSREIYMQKKLALLGGDEELKVGVEEGRDLMSVLRKSVSPGSKALYQL